ncbi:hypothetical protein FOZ62_001720, partial [Perkinsus olseni]
MSFYSIVVTSIAALTSGGSPLQPGKYCSEYLHGKGDNLLYESCLYFELGPSTAKIDYLNYLNLHYFTFRYDNVTFEDDTFILKRHGHTEGQELYPYFDVGFDVKVSTETPDVVKMVTKDGKHVYELTTKSCERPKDRKCIDPIDHRMRRLGESASTGTKPPHVEYAALLRPDHHAFYFMANWS